MYNNMTFIRMVLQRASNKNVHYESMLSEMKQFFFFFFFFLIGANENEITYIDITFEGSKFAYYKAI